MEFKNNLFGDFSLRKSRIPNAGLGVFAEQNLRKNTRIGYYDGKLVTDITDAESEYAMRVGDKIIDASSEHPRFFSAMINDARGTGNRLTVEFVEENGRYKVLLVTLRAIRKGEELYVDYGDTYWETDNK